MRPGSGGGGGFPLCLVVGCFPFVARLKNPAGMRQVGKIFSTATEFVSSSGTEFVMVEFLELLDDVEVLIPKKKQQFFMTCLYRFPKNSIVLMASFALCLVFFEGAPSRQKNDKRSKEEKHNRIEQPSFSAQCNGIPLPW